MALLSQQFPIGNCYHHNICPETNGSSHYKEEKGGKTLMMMKGLLRIPLSSFQSFPFSSSSRGTSARVLLSATYASVAVSTSGASQDKIVGDIRWGWSCLQGLRSEMEDDVVVRSDSLNGFHFAAVFDGHAGFSSVRFLRDELYKECAEALQGGLLLKDRDFTSIKEAIQMAFANADSKLLGWLDQAQTDNDSGSTATVIFVGGDMLIISHVGDSCVVLSRAGKAETLNSPHRPYGNNRASLEEIRRIREAGGWIVDGRICGDISVSRAFGDIRFKTRKIEMLERGVKKGRWTRKFVSRIQINGDWVTSVPDIRQVSLCANSEFLLLASDGLWDYMSSSEAVRFVRNQLHQHGDVQAACEALARAALDRKSQDNISIVIADLGRTNWQTIPPEEDGQNFFIEIGQAFATISIVSMGIWLSYQFAP